MPARHDYCAKEDSSGISVSIRDSGAERRAEEHRGGAPSSQQIVANLHLWLVI